MSYHEEGVVRNTLGGVTVEHFDQWGLGGGGLTNNYRGQEGNNNLFKAPLLFPGSSAAGVSNEWRIIPSTPTFSENIFEITFSIGIPIFPWRCLWEPWLVQHCLPSVEQVTSDCTLWAVCSKFTVSILPADCFHVLQFTYWVWGSGSTLRGRWCTTPLLLLPLGMFGAFSFSSKVHSVNGRAICAKKHTESHKFVPLDKNGEKTYKRTLSQCIGNTDLFLFLKCYQAQCLTCFFFLTLQ